MGNIVGLAQKHIHLHEDTALVVSNIYALLHAQDALPFAATKIYKSMKMFSVNGFKHKKSLVLLSTMPTN